MNPGILLLPIFIPLAFGLLVLLLPSGFKRLRLGLSMLAALLNLLVTVITFKQNLSLSLPWAGFGLEFSLRLYSFSAFINLATAVIGFLIALYTFAFLRQKDYARQFCAYFLLTLSFANGVVLADNLVLLLFFWEGLLLAMFGMIYAGAIVAFRTAIKMFIIVGIADLCMMAGIALTACLASSLTISKISLTLTPLACLAFFLLMIGAIARAGSMPFHSWIPDAAIDAPLPFMALLPAALEKLLGIYLLTRIAMDMFKLTTDSWLSLVMMIVGAATIILAVMMALIQRDYKRLLSFHAISQVGYMILGIGTAVPVGIVGGLFHMLNNALYKSCLFLTAGSVEKQTGTTDLGNLGGIASRMPVTFGCFLVTALSISGVPPFNGFFSKELVYDAALQRGFIFYLAAVVGSFFTAASFLKLGHAAYLGRGNGRYNNLKEASWFMLAPMIVIASLCAIFGVFNGLPLKGLIQPVLGERLAGHSYAGMPSDMKLVAVTIFILAAALLNHILSVKITGSALKASDIFHYTPVLSGIYDKAERGRFDPYELGLKLAAAASAVLYRIDRMIDWVYDNFSVGITDYCSGELRKFHSGKYTDYLRWSLLGMLLVALLLLRV